MSEGAAASGLRALMRQAPQLVTVVTAQGPEGPRGITVSSMIPVSMTPPLLLVSISDTAAARPAIAAGRFRVHLLAEDQASVSSHFATPGLTSEEQFAGPDCRSRPGREGEPPLVSGCIGWVDCRTVSAYPGGDHTLFVGRILEAAIERPEARPLVYQDRGYRRVSRRGS